MTQVNDSISQETPAVVKEDVELLRAFSERREEAAFAEVVRRHGGMVLSVCRSVMGNTADAEDAAQAVFLTLAKKARSVTVRGHLVGWLHRVAWYVAKRAVAKRAIRRRHEEEAARMIAEEQATKSEGVGLEDLHESLEGLSEKYRVAMILHHVEGKSQAETARLVGCSVEAVAVRLHRGREMIRENLRKRGLVAPMTGLAGIWGIEAAGQVSAEFVESTASAAGGSVSGGFAGAGVSGQTAAMANDALRMLLWERVKRMGIYAGFAVGVLLLMVGVIGTMLKGNEKGGAWVAGAASGPVRLTSVKAEKVVKVLPGNPVTGVIVEIAEGAIVLRRRVGPAVRVAVDEGTVVKIDDVAASLAELKVGMSVATFSEEGKAAVEIWVRTEAGAGR